MSFVELDVANRDSIRRAAKEVAGATDHLDALINNAGVLPESDGDVLQTDPETLLQTINTNALGPLRVVQAFTPGQEQFRADHQCFQWRRRVA